MFSLALLAVTVASAAARSVDNTHFQSAGRVVLPRQAAPLSSTFKWNSTGPLIAPKNDGRNLAGIKDPSIVHYEGKYHVFASTSKEEGYNMVYMSFKDFSESGNTTFHYLDQSPIGTGYRAAPQVFWFEPHKLWYLIYQNGNAAYSTNKNISNPLGWTAPKDFYSGVPSIVTNNIGQGYWVDMWVICDASDCHLFSSDDNGQLYRSQTPIDKFPAGMSDPVIAMKEPKRYDMFEASNVYRIGNSSYLLLVECIGATGERYFRSWTSSKIAGPWNALADTEAKPFAGAANVAFTGTPWTKSISHGEVIRTQVDQTMTIRPCNLQYLYQGMNPAANGSYNSLPWRLALLTQVDSTC